jgi:hypothetical protein
MNRMYVQGLAALLLVTADFPAEPRGGPDALPLPATTAALSLAEEGRIQLGAPVAQLLPSFELNGEPAWMNGLAAKRLSAAIQGERLVDYIGDYADHTGVAGRAIVALAPDGNLHIQFPDLDNAPERVPYDPVLHPLNRDNFALNIFGQSILVTGIRDGGSAIVHLRTRVTVLTRMPVTQAAQRVAAPVIDLVALKCAVRAAAREREILLTQ